MVSMGCRLNHQCDSVVPLPLGTGLQSLGTGAGEALSPTFPHQAAHVLYAAPVWVQAEGKLHYV